MGGEREGGNNGEEMVNHTADIREEVKGTGRRDGGRKGGRKGRREEVRDRGREGER